MVDNPGNQQNQGTDFNALITRGNAADATQRLQEQAHAAPEQARPAQAQPESFRVGSDPSNTSIITNKVLDLNYNDPNFDTKLNFAGKNASQYFNQIKIDNLPPGSVMHTWMDANGYYIWTTDNPKGKHYLPENALGLMANNAKIDLEKERIKDNKAFAQQNFGGFQNFDRNWVPSRDGTVNATNYYSQIANASGAALDIQGPCPARIGEKFGQSLLQDFPLGYRGRSGFEKYQRQSSTYRKMNIHEANWKRHYHLARPPIHKQKRSWDRIINPRPIFIYLLLHSVHLGIAINIPMIGWASGAAVLISLMVGPLLCNHCMAPCSPILCRSNRTG